jgi:hypothetical protein
MALAEYTKAVDLKAVDFGGTIKEDVMDQIWDISKIPLPFTDLVGTDDISNPYYSWTTDKLADPALGGWVIDGSDSDKNDSRLGRRLGNHAGILTKEVQVSQRAQNVDTIGHGDELAYQVMMRQRELRRNVEANALGIQGSQEDNGADTPGIVAGLACMMTAAPGGTGGVFANGAWTAAAPPAKRALTETMVRDALQAAWEGGADPSYLMSVPGVIRGLSEYMFTSSSRIATLTRETQSVGEGGAATAVGAVNVFITDFGVTLTFIPNRLQQLEATDAGASVFIWDPAYVRLGFLEGYRTEPLAKTGLTDKRLMKCDFGLKMLNPDSGRVILGVDPAAAVGP